MSAAQIAVVVLMLSAFVGFGWNALHGMTHLKASLHLSKEAGEAITADELDLADILLAESQAEIDANEPYARRATRWVVLAWVSVAIAVGCAVIR